MKQRRTSYQTRVMQKGLLAAAFAAAVYFSTTLAAQATAPAPATEMTDLQRQQLENQINDRANEIANSRKFFEDERRPIVIQARIDRYSNALVLDIDATFSKDVGGLELEDFMSYISAGMEDLTGLIPGFTTTEWMIGGEDMDYWFDRLLPDAGVTDEGDRRVTFAQTGRPKIVVAAGHGMYFHTKYKWITQRRRVNGIIEDDITQDFARELSLSTARNNADPIRIRGGDVSVAHGPSGAPWKNLAARYHIENWRPDNPELWNTKPGETDLQREMHQDIRSRPLYANFIGANAIAHIHTNASEDSATGTRIVVHPGRTDDFKLAQLTLCSMKEAIQSDAQFAGYTIPLTPSVIRGKGENTFAKVPSMIVEVGFHTNVSDAKILQDPKFQKLSMRGVAKGMRLFREGASCAPFVVSQFKSMTGVVGKDVHTPIHVFGNPVYPIRLITTWLNCPAGRDCKPTAKPIYSQTEADAYRFRHLCWRGDEAKPPAEFRVEAEDLDGLRTPSITYQVNCVTR